jgi:ATP-binding cassette subfamily A (ABC1) protein 3
MLTPGYCEAFFHKAQLSGIVTTIVSLLLAVLAQVIAKSSTGAVAILSILFPPMNYTFFTILMARWERQDKGTNLIKAAPENPSTLPGIAFFIFAIIQIMVFPILGAIVERTLYGTASKGRQLTNATDRSVAAVQLTGFTKRYTPSFWARNVATRFGKRKETVVAVDDLNLTIPQGQIMVLLGANGSGKSTTLEAISGLNTITSGTIAVDGYGGLGICPQKNVLWDNLTSYEHVKIFNRLKSTGSPSSKEEMHELIAACDLDRKIDAQSRQLSGGQKRKLQLRCVHFRVDCLMQVAFDHIAPEAKTFHCSPLACARIYFMLVKAVHQLRC